ncbi:MAG TPA: GNAT family N-acetyltransferase [Solirubrobacteraceae bacterium]|nr:GNAT family N-acetyltransferase [Solirubrobacteraceae bacterium]
MRRELPGGFELDDDRSRIDVDAVHAFISEQSYWGRGRSRERVQRTVDGSARVLGLYLGAASSPPSSPEGDGDGEGEQVGFARAVTDGVTVGYIADVYVLPAFRGRGLGLELVREIVSSPDGHASEVRWMLHTADAQGLYAKVGFVAAPTDPPTYPLMERARG